MKKFKVLCVLALKALFWIVFQDLLFFVAIGLFFFDRIQDALVVLVFAFYWRLSSVADSMVDMKSVFKHHSVVLARREED